MTRDEVLGRLRDCRDQLSALDVKSLVLFGSVARGEENPESDVDLLVDVARPVGLFAIARLRRFLEGTLHRTVDLVTPGGLRPEIRENVLRDGVRAA